MYSMTQNCQRSVVQLDLEPPRPYNAGSCGSCLTISDDNNPIAPERSCHADRGKDGATTRLSNTPIQSNKVNSGLPATSRNSSPIAAAADETDVATLTCSQLRKAIGDKTTFCSLVDSQCSSHCNNATNCGASDCSACSQ